MAHLALKEDKIQIEGELTLRDRGSALRERLYQIAQNDWWNDSVPYSPLSPLVTQIPTGWDLSSAFRALYLHPDDPRILCHSSIR